MSRLVDTCVVIASGAVLAGGLTASILAALRIGGMTFLPPWAVVVGAWGGFLVGGIGTSFLTKRLVGGTK